MAANSRAPAAAPHPPDRRMIEDLSIFHLTRGGNWPGRSVYLSHAAAQISFFQVGPGWRVGEDRQAGPHQSGQKLRPPLVVAVVLEADVTVVGLNRRHPLQARENGLSSGHRPR